MGSPYRPFNRQRSYFDRQLNDMVYKLNHIFPDADTRNLGFYYVGMGSAVPFSVLMTDCLPDLHVTGAGSGGQFFPRYTYVPRPGDSDDLLSQLAPTEDPDSAYERLDNISDWALADYRSVYGAGISKDDIFYYIYGVLHSPDYRVLFAADLKRMLPHIPKVNSTAHFNAFTSAGRELAALHVGYESVDPYPLDETPVESSIADPYRVRKMTFGKGRDRSRIIYNEHITLSGIPEQAYEYLLGSRSAIEWIMERYQVKRDKASGITNDPNDWCKEVDDARYIIDLLKRIVTVSLRTVSIVRAMPELATDTQKDAP